MLIESGILFQIKAPEMKKACHIFSSNLFNRVVFIGNKSSPVTVDRRLSFVKHQERADYYGRRTLKGSYAQIARTISATVLFLRTKGL